MLQLAAILPAAGSSTRFGRNKLIEPLRGETVLARSLKAFCEHPSVGAILLATSADSPAAKIAREVDSHRVTICDGGATRAQSVLAALERVPEQYEWVAIHDAARPLVSRDLIDRTFAAAVEHGAAVPALPVSLTIKQATGPLPAKVQRTIARHELWAMQTPQIVRRTDLLDAFERCPIPFDQITDDVQLLELQGKEVWLVPGDERNLKITTTLDLKLAELILQEMVVQ
jgi:2-C-methyl-D-erythritol 4-phosphate cytidylyltransferase